MLQRGRARALFASCFQAACTGGLRRPGHLCWEGGEWSPQRTASEARGLDHSVTAGTGGSPGGRKPVPLIPSWFLGKGSPAHLVARKTTSFSLNKHPGSVNPYIWALYQPINDCEVFINRGMERRPRGLRGMDVARPQAPPEGHGSVWSWKGVGRSP